jgi:hypothetical protein
MSLLWFNFIVVVLAQLVIFLVHAYIEKRLFDVPRILMRSMAIGIPFGIVFDVLVGDYIGLYSYELGMGLLFLLVNGALSFGFMQANALLMDKGTIVHFYIWSVNVGVLYEVANVFFPVWEWEFASRSQETLVVVGIGYFGLAVLMAFVWHFIFRHHFAFISRLLT